MIIANRFNNEESEQTYERYIKEAERMHLKKGRYYSYRSSGARQVLRYDGIDITKDIYGWNISIKFFGQEPVKGNFNPAGRIDMYAMRFLHSTRGLKKANRHEVIRLSKFRAKTLLKM